MKVFEVWLKELDGTVSLYHLTPDLKLYGPGQYEREMLIDFSKARKARLWPDDNDPED